MLSCISPSSSAAPSPRMRASPMPLSHTHKHLSSPSLKPMSGSGSPLVMSPRGSPGLRTTVHPVTPPPFALASNKQTTTGGLGASLPRQQTGLPSHLLSSGMYGSFDYESEGSTFPAKRMITVNEALKELEQILMADADSSDSSSSSSSDSDGDLDMDLEDEERDSFDKAFDKGTSLVTKDQPKGKPSKGWRRGVARESVRFQLLCDVPCWEPGCYSDLSTMHALRDKTLKSLHSLIDSLHLRGIRTTYRLHSTANGGAWGCIRVAPFMSSRLPPSSSHKNAPSPLSFSPLTPSNLLMNNMRRCTFAGSLPSASGLGGMRRDQADKREMDEKERVAKRVKMALEADGNGVVEENRTYLLAVNGQPALVVT